MQQVIEDFLNDICCGTSYPPACAAIINSSVAVRQGADTLITWTATGAVSFDVYVDGAFKTNTLLLSYVSSGTADGNAHTYQVVPRCISGAGAAHNGNFNFPLINPCAAVVNTSNTTQAGNDVNISWTATGAVSFDVYIDNVFKINTVGFSYTALNGADGLLHAFTIIPKCVSGTGPAWNATFQYSNCNAIVNTTRVDKMDSDVLISWTATGAVSYDVYIDHVFVANVAILSYFVAGGVDGLHHDFEIVPRCAFGPGISKTGEWLFDVVVTGCGALVLSTAANRQNTNDVLISWTASCAVSYDVYVDGVLRINTTLLSYLSLGTANNILHEYAIIPRCVSGAGPAVYGNYNFGSVAPGTGTIQVYNCVGTGRIISVNFMAVPVNVISGHQFPLFSGRLNNASCPAGTGILSVQADGDAGCIRVTDSNGTVTCFDYAGADTYEFPDFVINNGAPFSIVMDCSICAP